MHSTKLPRNSICPCGSGKKYKKCCIDIDFTWMEDETGNIYKSIPLTEELAVLLEKKSKRFKDTFGREPEPNDPVFFDQFYMHDTPENIDDAMLEIMGLANIDEAFKYAYKKTGRIVTEINKSLIPDLEIKEWVEAVDEYYNLQDTEKKSDDKQSIIESLISELEPCVMILGMIVKRSGSFDENYERRFTEKEYILFCVTKTFKTMKSIVANTKKGYIEDSFVLLRTIYENYINLLYISNNPSALENLIAIQIGIKSGTHEYGINKKGQIDKRKIIDNKTGKEYLGHISNYAMVNSSKYSIDVEIFDRLYEFLSSFTHPDLKIASHYMNDDGFDPNNGQFSIEDNIILSLFVCSFIFDELLLVNNIGRELVNDIAIYLKKLKAKLLKLEELNLHKSLSNPLIERTKFLLERYLQ
ncbi:SEC-C domain-containing protein [Paenibacillus xylanexedens]|uniref:SEC-C domain-containing protein n=1 Tax=Paenibacillus xylanexedens TaxID=528191 RepID=UPI00119E588D|nr:SEC-C domain-containing protein [Paenibacillus xylanexedens]